MEINILSMKAALAAAGVATGIAGAIAATYATASWLGYDPRLGGFDVEWMGKHIVTIRSPLAIYGWAAGADDWPASLIAGLAISVSSIALAAGSTGYILWHGFQSHLPSKFGKDAWGKRIDALKAGLIAGEGAAKNDKDSPFKIVLGEAFGSLLTSTSDVFVSIFGGTRLGKSRLMSMTGLTWKESAVFYLAGATDDIWEMTSGYRSIFSKVIFLDFSDPNRWRHNALSEIRIGSDYEWDDCLLIATQLPLEDAETARVPYYVTSAIDIVAAIIQHTINFAPVGERNMETVYKVAHKELSVLVDTLENCPIETVRDIVRSKLKGKPDDAKKVMEAAHNAISPWASPVIRKVTRQSDFRLSDLMAEDRPVTLYLRLPDNMTDQWARVLKVIISQLRNMMMADEHRTADGREKMHDVLFALDEFATFADKKWDTAMSRIAKYGGRILMAMQSPRTLDERFGSNQTVLENLGIQIYMSSADPKTQDMISRQVGTATELREARSTKTDFLNPIPDFRTKTKTEQVRSIMESSAVRSMPVDQQIVFPVTHKAFLVKKPIDFTDREPWKSMILPAASKAPPRRRHTPADRPELTGVSI